MPSPSPYLALLNDYNQPVYGVGTEAYRQLGPASYLNNYTLWCYRRTSDLDLYRQAGISIHNFQEYLGRPRKNLHNLGLLKSKIFRRQILKTQDKTNIFLVKSTTRIEAMCQRKNWSLLGNPVAVAHPFENKKRFRLLLGSLGLPVIPGAIVSVSQVLASSYQTLTQTYGSQLVIQLSNGIDSGGDSTYFVLKENDWEGVRHQLQQLSLFKKIREVNITTYLGNLLPATVVGCVTKHGVLVSPVWTQIIDQVKSQGETNHGKFNGNDWNYHHYSSAIQEKVKKCVQTVGAYMQTKGYKGVFGMDILVDEAQELVYGIECNARFTGSFPIYTWLQLARGETPIEAFHFLEFLDISYELDLEEQMASWQQPTGASQLILVNPYADQWVQVSGTLLAGSYQFQDNKLERVGNEFNIANISQNNEFIWGSNTPYPRDLVAPGARIGKLYFPYGILGQDRQLVASVQAVVKAVYKQLALKAIAQPEWEPNQNRWLVKS